MDSIDFLRDSIDVLKDSTDVLEIHELSLGGHHDCLKDSIDFPKK
jgi:hypothetical protein